MAQSRIRRRQEAERQRTEGFIETLKRTQRSQRQPPDFQRALNEAGRCFIGEAIRAPEDWRPQMKTRDAGRLRLAAARHLFQRYAVPAHLEAIWLDQADLPEAEVRLRKAWYVAAAKGESLYKAGASLWLSRKETHAFLVESGAASFRGAFWQAIARGYTDDDGVAQRIARSKIARIVQPDVAFWREVVRFFCVNPTTLEEMDDLCDYLASRQEAEPAYSLKGRTLTSLRRASHEWHRDIAAVARIEALQRRQNGYGDASHAGRWLGANLPDWSWRPTDDEARARREVYLVVQLTSAGELVAESSAMHHCVWSYAQKCISGATSIWSLRLKNAKCVSRLLTIELDRQHRMVQVRGFGNRVAKAGENNVLDRWAKAAGIERV